MAKHIPVGIDLGTSRSLIAYIDAIGRPRVIEDLEDQRKLTPSIIMFDKEGAEIVINVGEVAKRAAVARPGDVIRFVKSHMHKKDWKWTDSSGKEWTPSTLSSLILKKMKIYAEKTLRENFELAEDQKLTHAVITVPYYFGDLERERTKEAGKIAGFEVMSIIDEPVAAAIAFGLNEEKTGVTSLIYDLGGGTFDIAVTDVDEGGKIKVIATHGHRSLGGANFDQIICDYFKEEFQKVHNLDPLQDLRTYQDFMEKAESSKEALSTRPKVNVPLSAGGKVLDLEFTREKLEELLQPLLNVTINLLEETLVNLKVNRDITPELEEYKNGLEMIKTEKEAHGESLIKQDETNLLEKLRDIRRKELNQLRVDANSNNSKKKNWEQIKADEWNLIDRILLVGGSTKIPLVKEMLATHSGKTPLTLASPDEAVALGAAAVAAWEYAKLFPNESDLPVVCGSKGRKKETVVEKIVSHSLGIKALIPDTKDKFMNCKIIYKGAKRPAEGVEVFTNAFGNQTSVLIELLQGEPDEAEYCQPVGEGGLLKGIPPMGAGEAKIKVILKYDEEDMIHVTAIEEISGETLNFDARVKPLDITKEKKEIDKMEVR